MTADVSAWTVASLAELADVVRGITFPASAKEATHTPQNVCCLRTSNVQESVEWGDVYFVPRGYVKRADQLVRPGDILMSMANSYELVGKVAEVKEVPYPTAFGAFLSAVRPRTAIDGKYLFHALRTSRVQAELRRGSSQTTNIANISVGKLSDIEIPLAPLAEQKRIASKLDTVLARVDACCDRLDRVGLLIKRFRQSVLAAAISGQLTTDWRAVRNNLDACPTSPPETWESSRVELVATVGTGSTPLRSNGAFYAETGAPWVTSAATGQPYIRAASEFVTEAAMKAHRLRLYPVGTLLVAMYGEGKTRGQVAELAIDATINQACAAILVDEAKAARGFVKLALQANYLTMRDLAEGGNQPNLNLSKVKAFPLSLPPLEEQYEILLRVDKIFSFADRLEARISQAKSAVDRLTSSVLAKAFRGELVPHDPSDEPAAELLRRLHDDRERVVKGTKTPRSRGLPSVSRERDSEVAAA
ncbi:restriction endonuclease subunit S [Ralstonia sp.]|uniref:restriction endonuclease subunit S n=1 Tax=Ralstonia sp. TaxID=54061 RepID=UPI0031DC54EC